MARLIKIISDILFITGLCLAGIFLFFHLTGRLPFKVFIVSSGSMEPAIKTGGLVIVSPKPAYQFGDIVTFYRGNSKKDTTTHRLVGSLGGQFRTAGDANTQLDPGLLDSGQIVGAVRWTVPYLGYLASAAKTPKGFILLVIVPATIIIYEELRSLFLETKKAAAKVKLKFRSSPLLRRGVGGEVSSKPLVVIPIFFALFIPLSLSLSYFHDRETSSGNSFTAAAVFPNDSNPEKPTPTPTGPSGPQAGDVVINEINWAGSNGDGNDEWLELKNMTAAPIDMTNWVVENLGTGSGPGAHLTLPSGTLAANGFFLISQHSSASASKINVAPDFSSTSVSLVNGGEQLVLKAPGNLTIDTANGTSAWFFGTNATPKKTMERLSPPGDGIQSSNWQTATTHTNMDASGPTDEFGTPKAANSL